MKKMILALATVLSFAIAAPAAQAATVDLTAVSNIATNIQASPVTQAAASLNASIGPVTLSTIDLSAISVANVATINMNVEQGDAGLANVVLLANDALNSSTARVDQASLTGNLTGPLDRSAVSGSALNALNLSAATITVKQ